MYRLLLQAKTWAKTRNVLRGLQNTFAPSRPSPKRKRGPEASPKHSSGLKAQFGKRRLALGSHWIRGNAISSIALIGKKPRRCAGLLSSPLG
jgi:hypothetical protein